MGKVNIIDVRKELKKGVENYKDSVALDQKYLDTIPDTEDSGDGVPEEEN